MWYTYRAIDAKELNILNPLFYLENIIIPNTPIKI